MTLASRLDELAELKKLAELDMSFMDLQIGVPRVGKDTRQLAKVAQDRYPTIPLTKFATSQKMGDDGAQALAKALKTTLDLQNNKIGDNRAQSLS
ncbi:hypothetical protein BGZ74_001652 [Mortierella antarctica]|nr:hypothetical protein BGZ74_001652 [Mortierella antarctica]